MSTFYRGNPADVIKDMNAADAASAAPANFNPDEFGGAAGRTVPSVRALTGMTAITFPQGLGDDPAQPFFMTYVPKKITSAVGGTMGDMGFQSVTVTKDNIAQVALPIPTGINAAYAQAWDQTDVSAVQGAVMRSGAFTGAASSLRDMSEQGNITVGGAAADLWHGKEDARGHGRRSGGLSGLASQAQSSIGALGDMSMSEIASGGKAAISTLISKIPQAGMSGNTLAGGILGVAGKLLGPAMSTAAGFASFNQMMAHYNGPAFRNFQFTYTLRPLEPKDQQNIVKIVNFFKIASAPSQISNGLFRIYEIPYIFKIGFYSRKGELQDVNKIAHCACTSVAVSYGGDRFQTFSGTDSPVETSLTLSFKEIEFITRTEMEKGY